MSAPVFIRKAEAREVEALADLAYLAWERDLLPYYKDSAELRRGEQRRLRQAVRDQLDRIIVGEAEGVLAGWCSRAFRRSYVPFLFVTPSLQNQGIGSTLLRRMESILELEGADRIVLDTLADNVRAVRFYEHKGYHILALKPDGPPGRDAFMSVRLEKRLSPYRGPVPDAR